LLGAGGLMGRYVLNYGLERGLDIHGRTRLQLDITRLESVKEVIDDIRPDWVVNAAACSRMEKCAERPVETRCLNVEAPAALAELGRKRGFRFCHVSSDYVFDGKASEPYGEEAKPGPISEYARQKAEADESVAAYPEHLILRVAWLFGQGGSTFMSKMPELIMQKEVLQVASGRKGNCLYMGLGAEWLFELLGREPRGIFNFVHPGETTWKEFALLVLEEMMGRGWNPKCRRVEEVPMEQMGALAEPRPAYTGLSVRKLEDIMGRSLPDWKEGARCYLNEIAGTLGQNGKS